MPETHPQTLTTAPLTYLCIHFHSLSPFYSSFHVQSAPAHFSSTWFPPWPCSAWTPQMVSAWASPSSGPSSSPPAPSCVGTDQCIKPSGGWQKPPREIKRVWKNVVDGLSGREEIDFFKPSNSRDSRKTGNKCLG